MKKIALKVIKILLIVLVILFIVKTFFLGTVVELGAKGVLGTDVFNPGFLSTQTVCHD